jgi:hypothetical protein
VLVWRVGTLYNIENYQLSDSTTWKDLFNYPVQFGTVVPDQLNRHPHVVEIENLIFGIDKSDCQKSDRTTEILDSPSCIVRMGYLDNTTLKKI